jgi:hypothetical protein
VICDPVDVATSINDQGNPVAAAEHPSVLRSSGRPARNGAATGAHAASRVREWRDSAAGGTYWKLPNGECKGLRVVGLKAVAAQ